MSVTFYYAVWCGHCKVTKPAWDQAKNKLKGVAVKEVEDSQMTGEDKAKVSGFPTFVIESKKGKPIAVISGERTDPAALLREINGKLRRTVSRRGRTHRGQRKLRHRTLRNYKALR